ncbi:MAG: cyclic nucleotide-binding domain-containing protein [Chloroflexi bacterium]|nr:MAG: cyclic nucleotide-binding domain-containing protein [Chloroflexota bacterium]TMG39135.1 MAG: cyclic nucleotide-binding domain-containing protein [Chloroflexota bacterium]
MPAQAEVVDVIARLALFADLSTAQLEGVAHVFEEAFFADGTRVLRQGLTGSGLYVILDGEAAIQVDGVERSTLGRGEFFGEISCLLDEPPVADIVAHGPLRCLVLPRPQVQPFLTAYPIVMFRMLQAEARKLRNTTKWLE